MTAGEALVASCLRSTLVVLIGCGLARGLMVWLATSRSAATRRLKMWLLAALFLTPNLMVGFGYRAVSVNLLNHWWLNELLYLALILMELTPAAVWLLLFAPAPALSPQALHCARMVSHQAGNAWGTFKGRVWLWWQGTGDRLVGPASLLFLLSFQESELAALMQTAGWPERLFTVHLRGLPVIESARLVLWPVVIQCLFIVPLVLRVRRSEWNQPLAARLEQGGGIRQKAWLTLFGWVWTLLSLTLVIGQPAWHLVNGIRQSVRTVGLQPLWIRELADAVLLAGTCSLLVWGLALLAGHWGSRRQGAGSKRGAWVSGVLVVSLVPGLTGTLSLGLLMGGFFQQWAPRLAYTACPLLLAEILWLWPRALLICEALNGRSRSSAWPVRLLMQSGQPGQQRRAFRLWWLVQGAGLAGGLALVAWWSYLEVMLPTLLGMPGFSPAPQVMYNHLHFGQLAAMGTKLMLILSVPGCLALAGWGIQHLWSRKGRA